ncbi:alpha/beta fold hydrolase [Sphingomonas mesophila]|uniref:alpha/beta fold hydrolase n=1 Tax=Sphingomonas mesophila TaxID=2303576 RepID=UPI0013C29FC8|nr:alpha/beta fold hydrolase [Sphingomonas mesophila]
MGVITTERGRIGLTAHGDGAATPIVFLHGVGSDKSVWAPQLAAFPERRALAFDYPGYGESDPAPGATRDDFAVAILDALEALGIPRAHVCGLSLGGVVAIALHTLAPERCASLILADSFARHPDGQAIYDRSIEAASTIGMRRLAEARAPALLGNAATGAVRDEVIAKMSRIDPDAYALGARAVWLADQVERARAIAAPTLVLVGDEDGITPPALSRELAELIPGARLDIIASAGHLANLECPAAFNRALAQFLSEID